MKKVFLYSALLLAGLIGSQLLPERFAGWSVMQPYLKWMTMFCLAFIMIHVGHEFDVDKNNLKSYGWDYAVAATAAAFPWIFCCLYFVFVLSLPENWGSWQTWKEMLLASRFAAPTSAGILFTMLAAAGLASTWVYRKARVLAIFDDLDTVLLMIPLKMLMVGFRWQLAVIVILMAVQLWILWRYLHKLNLSVGWRSVAIYAALIVSFCEGIYFVSRGLDDAVPIHIEVLLPAFVLGCIMAHPKVGQPHSSSDQFVSSGISALFMFLVGLSMPSLGLASSDASLEMRWETLAFHVVLVSVLSNLGKMFPIFCYRATASLRERLALCVTMFPRGEVGAGVLVVSLGYGMGGQAITVALLSLALNLLLTGVFILVVQTLLRDPDKFLNSGENTGRYSSI